MLIPIGVGREVEILTLARASITGRWNMISKSLRKRNCESITINEINIVKEIRTFSVSMYVWNLHG